MVYKKFLILLYCLHFSSSDWVADWMGPVQEQIRQKTASRRVMSDGFMKMVQIQTELPEAPPEVIEPTSTRAPEPRVGLKLKLEETINNAEELLEKLQVQIAALEKRERVIKDAIVKGRLGVSMVTVSALNNRAPRTYFIRDGVWSVCKGLVQHPLVNPNAINANVFNDILAAPTCIGKEVPANQDACVFNSVIKYETIPERRRLEYTENDFFCLKPVFNKTLEQYLSVPQTIVNNTCRNGIIRSLEENMQQCGPRILSEYNYYPLRTNAASLYPLEYCTEKDGSCKLIVAWHLTNRTVDNFEFLKSEESFKKLFIQPAEHIL
ncbi:hypothetical protein O0L34_g15012 [Tuta absoluta]|nr:hypothetical protein O0L34_g15012 [Tuta absoluta]